MEYSLLEWESPTRGHPQANNSRFAFFPSRAV